VQRVRTATDEHAALRRAVQVLGQSLQRRRPIEVARHSAEVRSHLRRWEAMLGLQPADAIVTEARQLLRQSRRFIRSRHRRQVGPDGLTSSFL
jgi:predicted nucleic acid-binding Zn ribbon protein